MVDRLPPHDIEAEESLIGAFILDGECIRQVINQVKVEDFYSERTALIFKSCSDLYTRREKVNSITISQDLARQGKLEQIGGPAFIAHCSNACPSSLDVESYANIITRLALSRRLIAMSGHLSEIGHAAYPDRNETLNRFNQLVTKFNQANVILSNNIVTPVKAANTMMEMYAEFQEHTELLSYGFYDLDRITTGINKELIIIGARPGVGKSQLMLDVAESVGATNIILFATSEMVLKQVLERKIARELSISISEMRYSGIPAIKEPDYMQLVDTVSKGNIHYITGKLYARDIYSEVQRMLETTGVKVVFVDYLQFLADCWEDSRENQNVRVGKACKILKGIVAELGVPVILASQLNRGLEFRKDKQPTLSDLRDSGNIEQDADVVLLLHRNEIDDYTLDSTLQVKQAKHRQLGVAPNIKLAWNKETHRYVNYSNQL